MLRALLEQMQMPDIGELTFDHGVPTKETSEKLYYEMDYHRATQAYLWSLPIVGQAQWRQSYIDLYDMKPNQMVYATQFNDRSLILTANESTTILRFEFGMGIGQHPLNALKIADSGIELTPFGDILSRVVHRCAGDP